MKKFFVIIVLFALPLVAYLFFASGVNNFARLPVLTQEIYPLKTIGEPEGGEEATFEGKITILNFPGVDPLGYLTNAYHLAEKIYDPYAEFNDFQFVSVVPEGSESQLELLKEKISQVIDLKKWKFVFASPQEIQKLYDSLETDLELSNDLSTPYVFIVDKNGKLRGRDEDDDGKPLFGYDTTSLYVLNNKMNDDVKVILAEYRLELKKYKKEGIE
ncbi:membrane protein [Salinimicrobium xinjiangense]|uniref:membrane protein n=1 Tax=Salinimicrobium xinjiangense TaxID=438596 RepID=UPI00041EDF74|nr:membrane protein [Salinimicrobium xinjiangense]